MPIQRAARSGVADKLAGYGSVIREIVGSDPDNLYDVRELGKVIQGDKKTAPHGHLVTLAIGLLWASGEVDIEYRAGKLLVGVKA